MLEMIEIGIDHSVAFRISGKVTEGDMSLVLTEAKEKLRVTEILFFLSR